MAERQTITERIARIVFELVGAEEVEARITKVDAAWTKMATRMQSNLKLMNELSASLRTIGKTISGEILQQLPQTTKFLEQFAIAGEKADIAGQELSLSMYVQSEEGRKLATSLGLVIPKLEKTKTAGEEVKDAFWKLNSVARALLRVFVAFKILIGVIGIFRDMAVATVELQREMWSLRVIISGAGQEIEGGLGSWDSWLERIQRMRRELPLIKMTDLVRGMKTLIVTLDDLGLAAGEMEYIIQLAGEMAIIMGLDFPAYAQRVSTALQGQVRNWATLGVNVRDSSAALREYSQELGYNWDELNKQQKVLLRTLFLTKEFIRITEETGDVLDEEWAISEALRAKRADLIAQQPKLIQFQNMWNQLLILGTEVAAIAADAITRFFATIVSGIGAALDTVLLLTTALMTGELGWERLQWILDQYGKTQAKIYEDIISGSTVLEWLGKRLGETGEEAEEAGTSFSELEERMKSLIDAAADTEDAFDDLGDVLSRALSQAQSALRSWRQALEQAQIQLSRRLADIARNLERRLADLRARYEARRSQLLERFEERRRKVREDGAEREEELREDHNKNLQRMEEDHQREMRQLRDEYLLDLEEAARKRDAISMRRIQQRYALEKKQREEGYDVNRRRAIEDFKEQLQELREAIQEQLDELTDSLERQLEELRENYVRQQEEARRNAECQRQDAIRNYQEREADLWESLQNRLEAILIGLMEEEEEWEGTYAELRRFLDEWYEGDLGALREWLNRRLALLQQHSGSPYGPPPPLRVHPLLTGFGLPESWGLAAGGIGIARRPTSLVVGEGGPEMFAAWPLGQRMPRTGVDIRLTIDGEQRGAWSGDFENSVLRVMRSVLEEVL